MTFAEKLKERRKQARLSQETLAEKLGVSRQAITKWETGAGTPDTNHLIAISSLFGVSLDELLSREKPQTTQDDQLYESVTEYDIDCPKRYDLKCGGAKRVCLTGCDGEKLRVRLSSDQAASIQSDLKARIDDERDRIDLDINRRNGFTEAMAKEMITITISVPKKYIRHIELTVNAEAVELFDIECGQVELDIKAAKLLIDHMIGTVEVNCNLDMDIACRALRGTFELNQLSATSKITLEQDCSFRTLVRGIGNSVSYERNGKPSDDFSDPCAENMIELNGMKSELIIAVESRE